MCGRYVRKDVGAVAVSFFKVSEVRAAWKPSFNVAPSSLVPVVRLEEEGRRELVELNWGLIPAWAKPDAKLPMMINARAETVASKPSYRSAFTSRRCIVPASGYFEWKKLPDGKKQPYYFQRRDGQLIAFAGIWEGQTVATITTAPNLEAAAVHDRMPVILNGEDFTRFLDPTPLTDEERRRFLAPSPPGTLECWPVDRAVGNVRNNNPGLILPLSNSGEDLFTLPGGI
jgi:putative SOS response-associated peptidase YedK